MAEPVTPNYNFNLPTVGGDDNVWGGLLNDNWASIDTILWTVSGVASAALTQAAGDARYLRLTGGTIGPNSTIFNGPAQFNNYTGFTSTAAFSGQAQFTGGATFGTSQVFFNSPVTFSASMQGVTPPAADNSQQVPTTSWVNQAVSTAIGAIPVAPAPSNNAPLMNGTAAPGLLATYSRGDHVHPSDTSRLALAGGTLTGPVNGVTPAVNNNSTLLATTAYVQGQASSVTPPMNGTAAIGTGTTWARADHVHPTDTSRAAAAALANYLPLTGGTLSGNLGVTGQVNATSNVTTGNVFVATNAIGIQAQFVSTSGNPTVALYFPTISNNVGLWYYAISENNVYLSYGPNYLRLQNTDNTFAISSATAYKPGGGSWTAPSDDRIKTVRGDYSKGLADVLALRPVEFVYRGNDTPTADVNAPPVGSDRRSSRAAAPYPASQHYQVAVDQTPFVGFVAQELEPIFPGMVTQRDGFIDGEAVTDLRDVDVSNLIYALVNAVKTLAGRVEALEGGKT